MASVETGLVCQSHRYTRKTLSGEDLPEALSGEDLYMTVVTVS